MMNDDRTITELWNAIRWLQGDVRNLQRDNSSLNEQLNRLRAELVSRMDPRLGSRD